MASDERTGLHPLLLAALEAEDAFQAAVVEHYGARNAGDDRYRYDHPPHIKALAERMRAACDEWLPIARLSLIPRAARAAVLLLALALPAIAGAEPQTCGADTFGAGGGCVNVNTATVEELATLHRIGPALAERIVADREANGAYTALHELTRVKGVGPLTVCYNQRAMLTAGPTTRTEGYKPEAEVVDACKATEEPADYCHDC